MTQDPEKNKTCLTRTARKESGTLRWTYTLRPADRPASARRGAAIRTDRKVPSRPSHQSTAHTSSLYVTPDLLLTAGGSLKSYQRMMRMGGRVVDNWQTSTTFPNDAGETVVNTLAQPKTGRAPN